MGGISVRVQSMVRNGGALSEISCVFCGQWPYFNIMYNYVMVDDLWFAVKKLTVHRSRHMSPFQTKSCLGSDMRPASQWSSP